MFWSDPNLYGVNFRDMPNTMPMNLWANVPRFIPPQLGFTTPYYNVAPSFATPWVRPDLFSMTPFVRPDIFTQFGANPYIRPETFSHFNKPELLPQMPFNPYINVHGWQRPFGF